MNKQNNEQPEEKTGNTGEPTPAPESRGRERARRRRQQQANYNQANYNAASGIIWAVPDSILPPEAKEHLWRARREALLASRSVFRSAIFRFQDRSRQMRHRRTAICREKDMDED